MDKGYQSEVVIEDGENDIHEVATSMREKHAHLIPLLRRETK
jgi:hypothetical protein